MASSDIDIRIRLRDAKRFQRDTRGAEKSVTGFGKSAVGASRNLRKYATTALGVVGAYKALAKAKASLTGTIDLEKATNKLVRAGFSPGLASSISAVAKAKEMDASAVGNSFTIYNKFRKAALADGGSQRDAFRELGISMRDLSKLSADDQLGLVTDRLNTMSDAQNRNAVGAKLFGRGWQKMTPILAGGSAKLEQYQKLAKKYGLTFSKKELADGQAMIAMELEWKFAMMGLEKVIATKIMPVIQSLNNAVGGPSGMVAGIKVAVKWTRTAAGAVAQWYRKATVLNTAVRIAGHVMMAVFGKVFPRAVAIVYGFGRVLRDIGLVVSDVLQLKIGKALRGMVRSFRHSFGLLGSIVKTALMPVALAWNALDFGIHVKVPGWVPGIGGKGFNIDDIFPDIPGFADGGRWPAGRYGSFMTGERGPELQTVTPGGISVQPLGGGFAGAGGYVPIVLTLDGRIVAEATAKLVRNKAARK